MQIYYKLRASFCQQKSDDLAAGNFRARISRGLCCEIVGLTVNNYRSAHYVLDLKAVCESCEPSVSVAAQKRRQIARVMRMACSAFRIVRAHLSKRVIIARQTPLTLVDMKTENTGSPLTITWQSEDLSRHDNAEGRCVKIHTAVDVGIFGRAYDRGARTRISVFKYGYKKIFFASESVHYVISFQFSSLIFYSDLGRLFTNILKKNEYYAKIKTSNFIFYTERTHYEKNI